MVIWAVLEHMFNYNSLDKNLMHEFKTELLFLYMAQILLKKLDDFTQIICHSVILVKRQ